MTVERLEAAFGGLPPGEAALVAYLMAGDPDADGAYEYARAVLEGGADALEIGVPFSDPVADGPTIQAAGVRALKGGARLADAVALAARLREVTDKPLLLMMYYNPIYQRGLHAFAAECGEAGVDALIVPDVPLEESGPLAEALAAEGVGLVQLASPASPPERVERLAQASGGFLYLVSSFGVTGARRDVAKRTRDLVASVKKRAGDTPVAVGFGVSEPAHVAALREAGADGVVVGSAIVSRIAEGRSPEDVAAFVAELKAAARGEK